MILPEAPLGYRVTSSAIGMREYGIITFNVYSKQVQKDALLEGEEEEQASPLREDRQT